MPTPVQAPEGLSTATAQRRLEEDGFNELPRIRFHRLERLILDVLREPMVALLFACGAVYFMIGDREEAAMLLGFVVLITAITVGQQRKADHALEALVQYASPRALVLRDGVRKRIQGRELVRGDIVFLEEGDRVSADGALISDSFLAADESLISGESAPIIKSARNHDNLYSGTLIVKGHGTLRVTRTGLTSHLGKIGLSLGRGQKESTRLEQQIRRAIRVIASVSALLCLLVFFAFGVLRDDWITGLLAGLTLAMAILPNELPAVLTIYFALGAWRISQRRVLTRRIPVIEALGTADVLCVDKTGTLTLNRMALQKLYSNGQILSLQQGLGRAGSDIPEQFHELLEFGLLATRVNTPDPTDRAVTETGERCLTGTEHLDRRNSWDLTREYPLSEDLLSISQVWRRAKTTDCVVGAKGAPEAILDLCHLAPKQAFAELRAASSFAEQGLRVIGVAKAHANAQALPKSQHDFDFKFLGFLGLADPVRPGVPESIAECLSAGIRVVMITGDHPATARNIARGVGLTNPDQVITGTELMALSESALKDVARTTNVFSRMMPEQKLALVKALIRTGSTVAMTGDGVNDVPALRTAHIGIAMGSRGTDVAREAAGLVLLDDDFGSIVEAIRLGRRIYDNLRSAIIYLISVHIPIAGISVLPVFFDFPLVLLPIHIAFLHLIIEPASSILFEAEPADPEIMRRKPRSPEEPLFNKYLLGRSFRYGLSILLALVGIQILAHILKLNTEKGRALSFSVILISSLLLAYTRSNERPKAARNNQVRMLVVLASGGFLLATLLIPGLRELFRISGLTLAELILCAIAAAICVKLPLSPASHRSETC